MGIICFIINPLVAASFDTLLSEIGMENIMEKPALGEDAKGQKEVLPDLMRKLGPKNQA